jgi:hypothetical protein
MEKEIMRNAIGLAGLNRWQARPAGERAFSRLDLMAVVAGVSVMFLVLWSTLATSHDGSDRSVCVNNMKRLVTAVAMYATDNKDLMAYPNWGNTEPGWLYTPIDGNPPNLSSNPFKTNTLLAYQAGALWPYLRDIMAYRCPLDKTNASQNPLFKNRPNKLSTYVMNGAVCGYGMLANKYPNTYTLSQFNLNAYMMWEPDDTASAGFFVYNDASSYPDRSEGVGRLHNTGTPVATFGGHVEWTSFETIQLEQTTQGKPSRLWCNPDTRDGH